MLADISDLRRVVKVVRNGQLYDGAALGHSVGFHRIHAPPAAADRSGSSPTP